MGNGRGRPRTFDVDEALDKAMGVFWSRGFVGSSLADLTDAMGLNKPSLYAAFGDKEALYLSALARYSERRMGAHAPLLDGQDPRQAVESFLRSLADMFASRELPGGCFVINGSVDFGTPALPARAEEALRSALHANEAKLLATLKRAPASVALPEGSGAKEMAVFFMSVVAGMAVLAKSGASVGKLGLVIDAAMKTWPVPSATLRKRLPRPFSAR